MCTFTYPFIKHINLKRQKQTCNVYIYIYIYTYIFANAQTGVLKQIDWAKATPGSVPNTFFFRKPFEEIPAAPYEMNAMSYIKVLLCVCVYIHIYVCIYIYMYTHIGIPAHLMR